MILRDLLDLVNKEKIKRERVKRAQKFVVEMGIMAALGVTAGILFAPKSGRETRVNFMKKAVNTAATIKDTAQKKVNTVKDTTVHAAQKVCNVIKDVHGKTEDIKKDIKDSSHEVTKDIHKTGDNISNKLIIP